MIKTCDLHTHSVFSDGTCTPKEIIDSAINTGLSAVALCDHNTSDGLSEFFSYAEDKNIEAIAGAEFSTDYNGRELHLLGLFIPENHFCDVAELMKHVYEQKRQSNIRLVESLANDGYDIDYESIVSSTPYGKINRAHIAAELTRKGYTESIKQAFETVLSPAAGHYKEPKRPSFFEMIEFTRSINAVPVLAHPFLNLDEKELEILLPKARAHGLAGMECLYTSYNEETTQKSFYLADKFKLLYSGGSDFHGENKPNVSLGRGNGTLQIPFEWVELLKNEAQ